MTLDIQLIIRLDPTADMAHFSHRPALASGYSQPAFPLQFNLPDFIEESQTDCFMLLSMLHMWENMFLDTH
jgi:hypothetical protein